MRNYDLITPEGTKDLLFGECIVRRNIESSLMGLFRSRGYSETITPGLEFYDVFNLNSRYFPQENLYKLTDSKGRLLVMRPDNTMPIARIVATRLRDADLPLKLCYAQAVYTTEPSLKGRSDEVVQTGIELIGSQLKMADLEVISTAVDSLSSFGMEFSLELGHIGIFKELVGKLEASDKDKEAIRKLIENKNFPALNDLLDSFGSSPVITALKKLPALFGGEEVFEKAEELMPDENIKRILDELREIYADASELCGGDGSITVDLGLVNKTDYYTGLIIKGYLQGHGEEVLSGGRYDRLISEFGYDVPAIGFAVNINAVAKLMEKSDVLPAEPKADVIVYAEDGCEVAALKAARELREQGLIVENALFDDLESVREYAMEKKIAKVVVIDGESKEVNI
ncbi:ATP phosphoribosyltransferase regulatory subunit [Ruminococcus sp.]|uniref:ATP phosphoribosyltransferase regulatory subunit n=1 Tax=Ruminococcus sp. TaxID=41978 RepID=UPI0025E17B23|nr:ATP phosphoribosyltransferase regulatory subunit [Ruminococcus sp.]MBQ6250611.1 ATP phosphoribosyltransferase regulatory subunit [Ruminococcus sp.]MBR6996075.1 ATP phosphoribosyltransferase regulatory subunit [Ruminococcus sp.]